MTFHVCGYFPKKATPRPPDYDLPGVVEIASLSSCIAKSPDPLESWAFNAMGFYDEPAIAEHRP
jgi:hypothetical protein